LASLENDLWLGVQCPLSLIYLVRREPQEPVLGEPGPGPLHRGPEDERGQAGRCGLMAKDLARTVGQAGDAGRLTVGARLRSG
jgi:hypothetical protein